METESQLLPDTRQGKHNKCFSRNGNALYVIIVLLILTNIATIITSVYTDTFKQCDCDELNFESPDIDIDDGNQYNYGTNVCEGYRDMWDNPSIPLSARNVIGRAIFQTPKKIQEAMSFIKKGKRYDLGRVYSPKMPMAFGRYLENHLYCEASTESFVGSCTQGTNTNALGNIGTQFDYYAHYYHVDRDRIDDPDFPSNRHLVLFNNFRGDEVFPGNYSGVTGEGYGEGTNYFGADKLPMFFTKVILVDIAGYKNKSILDEYYHITADDFRNAMHEQNLNVNDIGEGDAVLIYTGWGKVYDNDPDSFYGGFFETPGILSEVVTDIIFDTNAAIIGSDNWAIDAWVWNVETNSLDLQGAHDIFLPCGGGFIHEALNLEEWVEDARNGESPWIGAYIFSTVPIQGSVASIGRPYVLV